MLAMTKPRLVLVILLAGVFFSKPKPCTGQSVSDIEPANNNWACSQYFPVGTQIQAEDYCAMEGMRIGENYYVGWINPDDWVAYGIQVDKEGTLDISFQYASETGQGGFEMELYIYNNDFGTTLARVDSLASTGGWHNWQTSKLEGFLIPAGKHILIIRATSPGWNLDWFQMQLQANDNGSLNDNLETLSCEIVAVGTPSSSRFQAADYCDMNGIEIGMDNALSDYVGWIDSGDWMLYGLQVNIEGSYDISYRFASAEGDGAFQVEVYNHADVFLDDPIALVSVDTLANTGDWHSWKTESLETFLPAGSFYVLIRATAPGWNLDWFDVSLAKTGIDNTDQPNDNGDGSGKNCLGSIDNRNHIQGTGFVRTAGTSIVDGEGNNLLLRGVGFGGWMLQEPYMMKLDESTGQRDLFARIQDLTGAENLETYRQAWLDTFCTKADIQELKDSGFNSLRAALHYELFTLPLEKEPVAGDITWINEGFQRLDLLLDWCREIGIYLILDLHAAPGGQGRNSQINDYDINVPSLWENDDNVKKTIALWVKFADRYKNEEMIAGYDLLNEPNWNFVPGHPNGCSEQQNSLLDDFYDRVIPAIRAIDTNHIIYIEGNCYANNHNGLWPISDDNVVLSFHKYWNPNTVAEIQKYLDWQSQYNVPLWMGEAGENGNTWYREAVELLESYNIGWAWWTWKKMKSGRGDGPFTIKTPDDYQTLLNYWRNGGEKPSAEFTFNAMMQVAENTKLENCIRNDNAIDALTGNRNRCDDSTEVVLASLGTTRLEAEDACIMTGFRTEPCSEGGLNVGYTDANDLLEFSVTVDKAGTYTVEYRVASLAGDGSFQLLVGSQVVGGVCTLPSTGDWQAWLTVSHQANLSAGPQRITVKALSAGWNLNWLQFQLV